MHSFLQRKRYNCSHVEIIYQTGMVTAHISCIPIHVFARWATKCWQLAATLCLESKRKSWTTSHWMTKASHYMCFLTFGRGTNGAGIIPSQCDSSAPCTWWQNLNKTLHTLISHTEIRFNFLHSSFQAGVQEGHHQVTAADFPAFLYDEDQYRLNPDCYDAWSPYFPQSVTARHFFSFFLSHLITSSIRGWHSHRHIFTLFPSCPSIPSIMVSLL